jgi:hypothetical protein
VAILTIIASVIGLALSSRYEIRVLCGALGAGGVGLLIVAWFCRDW